VSRHFAEIGYATIRPKHNPVEYWKSPVVFATPEENAARRKLEREQETILREVLGPDFKLSEDRFAQLYHGISAPTVEKMKKIFSDYRELEEQIREQAGPRDDVAAKFQLLEKEKRADIERALTPAELHTFDLRNGAGVRAAAQPPRRISADRGRVPLAVSSLQGRGGGRVRPARPADYS
jgi:hypothetical protein